MPTSSTASTAGTPARPYTTRSPAPATTVSTDSAWFEQATATAGRGTRSTPSLRAERDAASARAGGDRTSSFNRCSKEAVVYGIQSHAPRPITVLAAGGSRAARRAGRPGQRSPACPVCPARFRWPIPRTRGAVAPPWPTGSPAPKICSPGVRSPIASGTIISAGESSRRPTTSAATAPGRRIPSCSTGWPSSSAIMVNRSRPSTG